MLTAPPACLPGLPQVYCPNMIGSALALCQIAAYAYLTTINPSGGPIKYSPLPTSALPIATAA